MCRVWRYSLIIYLSNMDWLWLCVNDHCSDRWCGCVSGVSWPVAVSFDSHQLGESLTIVWKHPPCDQTNYISGYVVAYRKLTESNCDSATPGQCYFSYDFSVSVQVFLFFSYQFQLSYNYFFSVPISVIYFSVTVTVISKVIFMRHCLASTHYGHYSVRFNTHGIFFTDHRMSY